MTKYKKAEKLIRSIPIDLLCFRKHMPFEFYGEVELNVRRDQVLKVLLSSNQFSKKFCHKAVDKMVKVVEFRIKYKKAKKLIRSLPITQLCVRNHMIFTFYGDIEFNVRRDMVLKSLLSSNQFSKKFCNKVVDKMVKLVEDRIGSYS